LNERRKEGGVENRNPYERSESIEDEGEHLRKQ